MEPDTFPALRKKKEGLHFSPKKKRTDKDSQVFPRAGPPKIQILVVT
jgi:hypothetical protein